MLLNLAKPTAISTDPIIPGVLEEEAWLGCPSALFRSV